MAFFTSVGEAAIGGARPASIEGDRELKFALPGSRAGVARRWLEATCPPDPRYPSAIVWTVYYDTPDLRSLHEKIDSDYLKRKIRLRWYSDHAGEPNGPVFLEAKSRVGTRRSKVRVRVPHAAADVARWGLQDPRLAALPSLLAESGMLLRDPWQPILLVRYRRDRFVEPASRSRVSLDAEIAAVAVNHRFLGVADDRPIDLAVLEIKGEEQLLPAAVRPLLRLGARKGSFSKFLALYLHAGRQTL